MKAPRRVVTHGPLQEQTHTSDQVTATIGISEGQLNYITTHLKELGPHDVRLVLVGSRPNARVMQDQLQRAFSAAHWGVQVNQIGMAVGNFPDGPYMTGPDISSQVLKSVYNIVNGAGLKWELVPDAPTGAFPWFRGAEPDVVFVFH